MVEQDIFDRLKQDHDKHRNLLDQIEGEAGPSQARQRAFDAFKTEVTAHAATEEETLYATMMRLSDERHDAQHSVAEHKELGELIQAVADAAPNGDAWTEAFGELAKKYRHHIDEEEQEMFPKAKEAIGDDKAAALRDEYNNRKPEEVERALAGVDEGEERE